MKRGLIILSIAFWSISVSWTDSLTNESARRVKATNIESVSVRDIELIDARGVPLSSPGKTPETGMTVECEIRATIEAKVGGKVLTFDVIGRDSVAQGTSSGTREPIYIPYQQAIRNLKEIIAPALIKAVKNGEVDLLNQRSVDAFLLDLEESLGGSRRLKNKLGDNAILAVSQAVADLAGKALFINDEARRLGVQKFLTLVSAKRQDYKSPIDLKNFSSPGNTFNILNAGVHGDNNISLQEFWIIPIADTTTQRQEMAENVNIAMQKLLKSMGLSTNVGKEGGFAPSIPSIEEIDAKLQKLAPGSDEAIKLNKLKRFLQSVPTINEAYLVLMKQAVEDAGYKWGKDIVTGIDSAASEFATEDGRYFFEAEKPMSIENKLIGKEGEYKGKKGIFLTTQELAEYYKYLLLNYPIICVEDGFSENDPEGFRLLTQAVDEDQDFFNKLQFAIQKTVHGIKIMADDISVTDLDTLKVLVEGGYLELNGKKVKVEPYSINSILIKLNQAGTVWETIEVIKYALEHGISVSISHRSNETDTTLIADLAYAATAFERGIYNNPYLLEVFKGRLPQVWTKFGNIVRHERIVKYNRLRDIERFLLQSLGITNLPTELPVSGEG